MGLNGKTALIAIVASAMALRGTECFAPRSPTTKSLLSPPRLERRPSPQKNYRTLFASSTDKDLDVAVPRKSKDPTPWAVSFFKDTVGLNVQSATMASILALALAFAPMDANAAMSGGRMGGSFSSPSRSMPSSRVMPGRSSYGGGYGGGYGRGYGGGYGRGNSVIVAPTITPFYSPITPFYNPVMPFYGGGAAVRYGNPLGGLFPLVFFGFGAWALLNVVPSLLTRRSEESFFGTSNQVSALGSGVSVAQISVAMEVPNRDDPQSILNVLDRLSRTAKTDSRVGIQNLTSQVALELLRRKTSVAAAWTSSRHFADSSDALRQYQRQAIKERSKFEQETVSKYGGVDYSSNGRSSVSESSPKATMAVVTILVAIEGDSTKLPTIRSVRDVEEALRSIASDAKTDDCLQSAEILWTPESRTESLSLRDVTADYPELRSL